MGELSWREISSNIILVALSCMNENIIKVTVHPNRDTRIRGEIIGKVTHALFIV